MLRILHLIRLASKTAVSLWLGHAQALTTVQVVIHSLRAAPLPLRGRPRKSILSGTDGASSATPHRVVEDADPYTLKNRPIGYFLKFRLLAAPVATPTKMPWLPLSIPNPPVGAIHVSPVVRTHESATAPLSNLPLNEKDRETLCSLSFFTCLRAKRFRVNL